MKQRDIADLVLLAAIWGGSFLFMRVAAPEFGPTALAFLRVGGAVLVLLPLLLVRGGVAPLRRRAGPLLLLGLTNSALPFMLFGYALLTLPAGLASILTDDTIGSATYCYDPKNPHQSRALAATPGGLLQPSSSAFALLSHRQF